MPMLTIPVAMLIAGSASAGAAVYSSKRAGDTNDKAISAQERDAERAAELERADQERRERAYNAALTQHREDYASYERAHAPSWNTGQNALRSLQDLAGVGGGEGPMLPPGMGSPGPQGPQGAPPPVVAGGARPRDPRGAPSNGQRPSPAYPRMAQPNRGGMSLADLMAIAQHAAPQRAPAADWDGTS